MEKEQVELWQAEDIAGKLAVVHTYTGLELVVLDNLGDLRGKTMGFREESYSLLRRNQQALQKNELAVFANLTIIPLKQERQLRGWLAADMPAATMTETADCLFRELGMQLTFLLWHEAEIRNIERKHREQFLYDILYHNFSSSEEVIRMGRFWNMRLEKPHHVVVVEFDQHIDVDKHAQLLAELDREWMRILSARFVQPILMLLNMQLIILFEDDREPARSQGELAAIMADAMAKVKADFPTILPFSIGIGRLHYSVAEICRSFQEARQALSLGRFRQPDALFVFSSVVLFFLSQEFTTPKRRRDRAKRLHTSICGISPKTAAKAPKCVNFRPNSPPLRADVNRHDPVPLTR